ncbi:MAG: GAF domain-containing sensor histidine kinase [Solirubrobacterales bacterium]
MDSKGAEPGSAAQGRHRRLLDVGATIVSELDLELVLRAVVEAACELTGARYGALGVLDGEREELERFIHHGIDEETRREIGNLPRGRGVLGELIRNPEPLRLRDVGSHPHSYGFPPGHPPMRSFLGVPIEIRGQAFGNLYLTEKQGAEEFDDADQEAATTLALWAGIAIENARLYTSLSEREAQVERALRQAETSVDIARTVGGEIEVGRVLDLIVKRGRALVEARQLIVLLQRGAGLVVAAHAGEGGEHARDLVIPSDDSVFERAISERASQRLDRGTPPSSARLRERFNAEVALVVPLLFRGRAVGALVALDRETNRGNFDEEDQRLLQAFAQSAATAVATAQTVQAERLQQQVEIGERERHRWARELHDDTLQGLAAIRISLATALQSKGEERAERVAHAAEATVDQLESQISELSRLINDLRPATLERLGLVGALEALAEESAARGGFAIETALELPGNLASEEERALYRLAQEGLNNVVKHAGAGRVSLYAGVEEGVARVTVEDDGAGFDPGAAPGADGAAISADGGRGLVGMRERLETLGGQLEVRSAAGEGTQLRARFPLGA